MPEGPSTTSTANRLVARNVRRFREERQLSLGELAKRCGLAKQTLSVLEQASGNPTVDTLAALASGLGVTLNQLVSEWGSPVLVQRAAEARWVDGDHGRVRRLDRIYGSGYVDSEILDLPDPGPGGGAGAPLAGHTPGALHHVTVLAGRVRLGPVTAPVEVAEGDFVRFPADVEHLLDAVGGPARLHMVTTAPQVPQLGPAPR